MEVMKIFGITEVATDCLGEKSSHLSEERPKEFHKRENRNSNPRQFDCVTNYLATVHLYKLLIGLFTLEVNVVALRTSVFTLSSSRVKQILMDHEK